MCTDSNEARPSSYAPSSVAISARRSAPPDPVNALKRVREQHQQAPKSSPAAPIAATDARSSLHPLPPPTLSRLDISRAMSSILSERQKDELCAASL